MKTMRLLTAGLKTVQLDWALAVALGCTNIRKQHTQTLDGSVKIDARDPDGFFIRVDHTEPALCLKLINEWITEIKKPCDEDPWFAACGEKHCYGNTLEETVARCVVTTWFGEWVYMPIELCSMDVL